MLSCKVRDHMSYEATVAVYRTHIIHHLYEGIQRLPVAIVHLYRTSASGPTLRDQILR